MQLAPRVASQAWLDDSGSHIALSNGWSVSRDALLDVARSLMPERCGIALINGEICLAICNRKILSIAIGVCCPSSGSGWRCFVWRICLVDGVEIGDDRLC